MGFTVTYIYHDCFTLAQEDTVLIFDFWKDPLSVGRDKDFPPLLETLKNFKNVYVLVSHHHKDHFSRRIFLWDKVIPNITYIISKDVFSSIKYMFREGSTYKGHVPPQDRVIVLYPGQSFQDAIIKVMAFSSTDIGNSYSVEINGKTFFHAGDLNAWLWIDESTKDEIEEARRNFSEIVSSIKAIHPQLDLVMFPVDSRLGREYWWGAKYFVENIDCKIFIPMHYELVISDEEKEQRRMDAASFDLFARKDFGCYLQLNGTRSKLIVNSLN